MNHRIALLALTMLCCMLISACKPKPITSAPSGPPIPPPPPGAAPPPPPTASTAATPAPSGQAPLPPETKFGAFAGGIDDLAARPSSPQPAAPSSPPPPDSNTQRVKAQAGVGAKGRSLDKEQGILVTPVKAFFAARERIAFEQAFQGQYRLYRATEDPPKDFDDLKTKVLDPYQIKLPPLPPGHRYVWDAATEELQVERPKRQ